MLYKEARNNDGILYSKCSVIKEPSVIKECVELRYFESRRIVLSWRYRADMGLHPTTSYKFGSYLRTHTMSNTSITLHPQSAQHSTVSQSRAKQSQRLLAFRFVPADAWDLKRQTCAGAINHYHLLND